MVSSTQRPSVIVNCNGIGVCKRTNIETMGNIATAQLQANEYYTIKDTDMETDRING